MTSKNFREDKNFKIDLSHAKAAYRKKRFYIFICIFFVILGALIIQMFIYSNEKKNITTNINSQSTKITDLEKENKANEIIINKLKDPNFIGDMARSEYGLSYEGEIIFKLPEESYLDAQMRAILNENLDKQLSDIDTSKQIDDTKFIKKNDKNKKENKEETEKNSKKQTTQNNKKKTSN